MATYWKDYITKYGTGAGGAATRAGNDISAIANTTRNFTKGMQDAFYSNQLSIEELQGNLKTGTGGADPVYDPTKGPMINTGSGFQEVKNFQTNTGFGTGFSGTVDGKTFNTQGIASPYVAPQPIQPSGVPQAAMGATNLWEFYTKQNKTLPTVQQRAPLYASYGGTGTYTGTAEQNTFLLGKLKGGLPAAQAPSSADQMNQVKGVNLATGTAPEIGGVSSALAKTAGLSTFSDNLITQYTQNLSEFAKQKQGLASWLQDQTKNYQSQAELRQNLESQYGIKAKLAEIDSLGSDYNKKKAAMETDISKTTDAMASTGFISRQTAAIQRRYAPELNRIAADINFKTGLFTQSRDLIDQAVKDSVADQKYKLDTAKMFYDLNMDTIENMEGVYKDAYKEYVKQEEQAYDRAYSEKKLIADLAIDNPSAGISLNDTYEQAVSKVQSSGGSLAARRESRLGSESTSGISDDVATYAESYLNGDIDITNVPSSMRAKVLAEANKLASEALAEGTTKTITPEKTTETKNILNKLFEINPLSMAVPSAGLFNFKPIGSFFSRLFGK